MYKYVNTLLFIIKLTKYAVALRLRCGSCKLIFSSFFAQFKNVVHSLEPRETPIKSQNTLKRCISVAVRSRLFIQFT